MKTHRLRIHGRVQGVWFRESMRAEADRLGVAGWVKNLPDGTVEALVHGPEGPVDDLIAWAHKGPPKARVERVDIADAEGHYAGFEKRVD